MPTQIYNALGENLAETLDIGNYTNDGQKIRALNGTSSLNLRFGIDNQIVLTNDDVNFLLAYIVLFPAVLQMGFGAEFYMEVSQLASAFRVNSANAYVVLDLSAIEHKDISTNNIGDVHAFKLINITGSNIESVTTEEAGIFINSGEAAQPSIIQQNVKRSVCITGKGIVIKTDDTLGVNKITFQEAGNTFDNFIVPPAGATQNNTNALQNKSGTLAHLSDTVLGSYSEKWTLYNATLNATWETIVIADAKADSLIEITMENNSAAAQDMGVRTVGSALNRFVTSVGRSATTLTVKTNSSKEIQVYASVAANIGFNFSAQL